MPNEIDIAKLREDYKDFEGVEIPFHLHDAIRAIPALLDEVERLRGERETLNKLISMQQQAHIDGHAEIVAERDALKERLERVREWAGRHHSWQTQQVVGGLLAILEEQS